MYEKHKQKIAKRIESYKSDKELQDFVKKFYKIIETRTWGENHFWLGVPIFQVLMDLIAYQEIIWEVKPDLIIETGIKFGGSLIFSASMLTLLEACGEIENGKVIGVDIKLPTGIRTHPLFNKIIMLKGSSTSEEIIKKVRELAKNKKRIVVFLDSNHSHNHVLGELRLYAPLVSIGSYIVVEDTFVEDLGYRGKTRPSQWNKGKNPRTAVWKYLEENKNFVIDKAIELRKIFVGNPDGYLKRIK